MKSFLAFLFIPAAVLAGMAAARFAPAEAVTISLPAVQLLKLPLSPDALSPVSQRDPASVDFRYLMPLDLSPVQTVVASTKPLIVSAIFIDGERRVTQIGSETYQKGDSIAGYRVQRIEPMRVLLVDKRGASLWVEMARGY